MGLDRFTIFILLVNVALLVFAVWTIVDSNAALDECRRRAEGAAAFLGRRAQGVSATASPGSAPRFASRSFCFSGLSSTSSS